MSIVPIRPPKAPRERLEQKASRMYAIAFDLDTKVAAEMCGEGWRGVCYGNIAKVLTESGFTGQQGSLYFGASGSSPVTCITAVQELDRRFAWFSRAVRDLRMLRIEEENDLLPALSNRLRLDSTGTE